MCATRSRAAPIPRAPHGSGVAQRAHEALDSNRYRYHRLFRDFLRSELRRTRPDRWNALHRSAAAFYERRGNEDCGVLHHWVEAGEIEEAWSRFRRRVLPRFFDGAVTAVAQWTEMLPRPNVAIDVGQALDMALTLSYMGDIEGGSRIGADSSTPGSPPAPMATVTAAVLRVTPTRSPGAAYLQFPRLRAGATS